MNVIYHIATRANWERAQLNGEYTVSTIDKTLAEEGFIHASGPAQVNGTLHRYYRGVKDELLILVIDPGRVTAEIRYDEVPGADAPLPHIYGPLNADAVIAVRPLSAGPDGEFTFAPEQ